MFNFFKGGAAYIFLFVFAAVLSSAVLTGCDDSGIAGDKNNPNVLSYDSIWVEEDSTGVNKLSAINLYNGINVVTSSNLRDVNLICGDTAAGTNFYLSSGFFETKLFRVSAGITAADFDTITTVYNVTSPLDSSDFTHWSTDSWGFYNAPMSITGSHPVYCFWLKGRKAAHQNNDVNVFGIIQAREASDLHSGRGGFRMSFRVKINIGGENDFREILPD